MLGHRFQRIRVHPRISAEKKLGKFSTGRPRNVVTSDLAHKTQILSFSTTATPWLVKISGFHEVKSLRLKILPASD